MANNNKTISNPTVLINNIPIAIAPNSFKFTEGLGEQSVMPQSAGGSHSVTVYSEDVTSRLSTVSFDLMPTPQNIAQARQWKLNQNNNRIVVTDTAFSRSFSNASLTEDYEITLGADTPISLSFKSDPSI